MDTRHAQMDCTGSVSYNSYTMQCSTNRMDSCGTALLAMVPFRPCGPLSNFDDSKAKSGQLTAAGLWKQGRPSYLVIRTGGEGGRWRGQGDQPRQGRNQCTVDWLCFPREKAEGNVFSNAWFNCLVSISLILQPTVF